MMTWYDDVIMRTIIDLPAHQIEALDAVCVRDQISRAEAIRRAVALLIKTQAEVAGSAAFGLWRDRAIDGVEYQNRIRQEWHEPSRRRR